jgi:hypothetical protein
MPPVRSALLIPQQQHEQTEDHHPPVKEQDGVKHSGIKSLRHWHPTMQVSPSQPPTLLRQHYLSTTNTAEQRACHIQCRASNTRAQNHAPCTLSIHVRCSTVHTAQACMGPHNQPGLTPSSPPQKGQRGAPHLHTSVSTHWTCMHSGPHCMAQTLAHSAYNRATQQCTRLVHTQTPPTAHNPTDYTSQPQALCITQGAPSTAPT